MRIYKNLFSLSTMHIFVVKSVMVKTKISLSKIKSSCNVLCSWSTFLSYWCNNIANDESVKMERHLFTLLSLPRRERQIGRTTDMSGLSYMISLKECSDTWRLVSRWLILALPYSDLLLVSFCIDPHIRTPNFWGDRFLEPRIRAILGALPRVVRISLLEVAMRWFVEKKS